MIFVPGAAIAEIDVARGPVKAGVLLDWHATKRLDGYREAVGPLDGLGHRITGGVSMRGPDGLADGGVRDIVVGWEP